VLETQGFLLRRWLAIRRNVRRLSALRRCLAGLYRSKSFLRTIRRCSRLIFYEHDPRPDDVNWRSVSRVGGAVGPDGRCCQHWWLSIVAGAVIDGSLSNSREAFRRVWELCRDHATLVLDRRGIYATVW